MLIELLIKLFGLEKVAGEADEKTLVKLNDIMIKEK